MQRLAMYPVLYDGLDLGKVHEGIGCSLRLLTLQKMQHHIEALLAKGEDGIYHYSKPPILDAA
jgi:hypothetical protein